MADLNLYNVYVADGGNKVWKFDDFSNTVVDSLPLNHISNAIHDVQMWNGDLYICNPSSNRIHKLDGFSDTILGNLYVYSIDADVSGVTMDEHGNLLMGGYASDKFYKCNGFSTTITDSFYAGAGQTLLTGMYWDAGKGDLYSINRGTVKKAFHHNGFGQSSSEEVALSGYPWGIDFDPQGDFIHGDAISGKTMYKRSGFTTTILDTFTMPGGVDVRGNTSWLPIDYVNISEDVSLYVHIYVPPPGFYFENISVSEDVSILFTFDWADVNDELSLTEDIEIYLAHIFEAIEDVSITETISAVFITALYSMEADDSVSVEESVSFLSIDSPELNISESLFVEESVSVLAWLFLHTISVDDAVAVSESVALTLFASPELNISENVSSVEDITLSPFLATLYVNVSDSATVSDVFVGASFVLIIEGPNVSDSVAVAEDVDRIGAINAVVPPPAVGNLITADYNAKRIRRVDGFSETILNVKSYSNYEQRAGGVCLDPDNGDIIHTGIYTEYKVYRLPWANSVPTDSFSAPSTYPIGVDMDDSGNVFLATRGTGAKGLYKFNGFSSTILETFPMPGPEKNPEGIWLNRPGKEFLYTSDTSSGKVYKHSGIIGTIVDSINIGSLGRNVRQITFDDNGNVIHATTTSTRGWYRMDGFSTTLKDCISDPGYTIYPAGAWWEAPSFSGVSVAENFDIEMVYASWLLSGSDDVTVAESIDIHLDNLFFDIYEASGLLITEHTDVIDLVVEVGVVAEFVSIAEGVNLAKETLEINVSDESTATEDIEILDLVVELFASENIFVQSVLEGLSLPVLNIDVEEEVAVEETGDALLGILNFDTADNIGVVEAPGIDALISLSAFDEVTAEENIQSFIDILSVSVFEFSGLLITEHVDIVDLVVEVGVVAEAIPVAEDFQIYLDAWSLVASENIVAEDYGNAGLTVLFINIFDEITVVEDAEVVDIIIEMPLFIEDISVQDFGTAFIGEYNLLVFDEIATSEDINMHDIIVELFAFDVVNIEEQATLFDIVIELFTALDEISVVETATAGLSELFLSVNEILSVNDVASMTDIIIELGIVTDLISVVDDFDIFIGSLNPDVFDAVAVTEQISMHDIIIELFAGDDISAIENIAVQLPDLYLVISQDILVTEVALLTDIIIELGVVAEAVSLTEFIGAILVLIPNVNDSISVSEDIDLWVHYPPNEVGVAQANLYTSNRVTDLIYKYEGFTDNVLGTTSPPIGEGNVKAIVYRKDNLYVYGRNWNKVWKCSGFTNTVLDSFTSAYEGKLQIGMSIDANDNVYTLSEFNWTPLLAYVYKYSGFSSTVTDSIGLPDVIQGIHMKDGNLYCLNDQQNSLDKMSGFSTTVLDTVSILADNYGDLTFEGENPIFIGQGDNYAYRLAGFTSTLTDTVSTGFLTAGVSWASSLALGEDLSIAENVSLTLFLAPREIKNAVDEISVSEDFIVSLPLFNVSDDISTEDFAEAQLDVLNINVLDPFHVLITESISIIDLIVEVGVVMDAVNVLDSADVVFPLLLLSVADDITQTDVADVLMPLLLIDVNATVGVTESAEVFDIIVELGIVAEEISTQESVSFEMPIAISVSESISVVENIGALITLRFSVSDVSTLEESLSTFLDILSIDVNDQNAVIEEFSPLIDVLVPAVGEDILITEVVVTHDLVIELGVVVDFVSIQDAIDTSLDTLFISYFDEISVADEGLTHIGVLNISENEEIAVTEYAEVFDITIELGIVADEITVSETFDILLPELNFDVDEPFHVLITEVASVLDLVVEVGVVTEVINVNDFAGVTLPELFLGVTDSVSVVEWAEVFDIIIELGIVADDISVEESALTVLPELNITLVEDISIAEAILMHDIIIELGIATEDVQINEHVFIYLDTLNPVCVDDISTADELINISMPINFEAVEQRGIAIVQVGGW